MSLTRTALTLTLCMLTLSLSAQTNRYIDIEADQSKMINDGAAIQAGDSSYTLATKHDVGENVFWPTIVTDGPLPRHNNCFRFFMSAHPGTTTPGEKMLVNLYAVGQPYGPAWDTVNTIGFAIKLGKGYRVQTKNMQLSEWWQGSPYGPALEMILKPGTTKWVIGIENNANSTQTDNEIYIDGQNLKIGQWYHFAISVKPSYKGNGTVQVWQDGKLLIDNSAYPIGYNPATGVGKRPGKPMNNFDVEVGMYRPANPNDAEIFFDSLRWGSTYDDVK